MRTAHIRLGAAKAWPERGEGFRAGEFESKGWYGLIYADQSVNHG
jgi:hypothetical protein